jgi:N-methylhydantoinase B
MRLPGENEFRSMAGSHVPVPVRAEVIVRTGGGGGFGDPLEREPAAVRNDVLEEFITAASARDDYGVVLRDDLTLDEAATAALRRGIKARP